MGWMGDRDWSAWEEWGLVFHDDSEADVGSIAEPPLAFWVLGVSALEDAIVIGDSGAAVDSVGVVFVGAAAGEGRVILADGPLGDVTERVVEAEGIGGLFGDGSDDGLVIVAGGVCGVPGQGVELGLR